MPKPNIIEQVKAIRWRLKWHRQGVGPHGKVRKVDIFVTTQRY